MITAAPVPPVPDDAELQKRYISHFPDYLSSDYAWAAGYFLTWGCSCLVTAAWPETTETTTHSVPVWLGTVVSVYFSFRCCCGMMNRLILFNCRVQRIPFKKIIRYLSQRGPRRCIQVLIKTKEIPIRNCNLGEKVNKLSPAGKSVFTVSISVIKCLNDVLKRLQ
jgi:hypothetical protein